MKEFRTAVLSAGFVCLIIAAPAHSNRAPETMAGHQSRDAKRGAIEGVWQAVEIRTTGPHARTITPQPNLAIYAATHYSRAPVSADQPRPLLADAARATADELRATWGPFVAEAGTYAVAGNQLTMWPTIAKNPAAVGSSIVYSYKVEGEFLLVTAVSDRNGPVPYPETIRLKRME